VTAGPCSAGSHDLHHYRSTREFSGADCPGSYGRGVYSCDVCGASSSGEVWHCRRCLGNGSGWDVCAGCRAVGDGACPRGGAHDLRFFPATDRIPLYPPGARVVCDLCRGTVTGGVFHCHKCGTAHGGFDACMPCAARRGILPPRGCAEGAHTLRFFTSAASIPAPGYAAGSANCDMCGLRSITGGLFHCTACDGPHGRGFDACISCAAGRGIRPPSLCPGGAHTLVAFASPAAVPEYVSGTYNCDVCGTGGLSGPLHHCVTCTGPAGRGFDVCPRCATARRASPAPTTMPPTGSRAAAGGGGGGGVGVFFAAPTGTGTGTGAGAAPLPPPWMTGRDSGAAGGGGSAGTAAVAKTVESGGAPAPWLSSRPAGATSASVTGSFFTAPTRAPAVSGASTAGELLRCPAAPDTRHMLWPATSVPAGVACTLCSRPLRDNALQCRPCSASARFIVCSGCFQAHEGTLQRAPAVVTAPAATAPVPPPAPSPAPAGGSAMECVVCMASPKGVVFLPCRHMCCCAACASAVDRCPVCRTAVADRMAVFT